MKLIRNFLIFWYHFIIGDDWRIAVGVIVGFIADACLVHYAHFQLWWLMPLVVVGMLSISLYLASIKKK